MKAVDLDSKHSAIALTIIIPRYKTPFEHLSISVDSVKKSFKETGPKVVVVDSDPDDSDRPRINSLQLAQYVVSPTRLYVGAARNKGLRNSVTEIVHFLDSDCIMNECWVNRFKTVSNSEQAWDAITGPVYFENPNISWAFAFHIWEFNEFFGGKNHKPRFAIGCNGVFKRNFFQKIGLYREDWANIEDFEIFHRKGGSYKDINLIFEPQMYVTHQDCGQTREELIQKAEKMGFYRGQYEPEISSAGRLPHFFSNCSVIAVAFLSTVYVMRAIVWRAPLTYKALAFLVSPMIFRFSLSWANGLKKSLKDNSAINEQISENLQKP